MLNQDGISAAEVVAGIAAKGVIVLSAAWMAAWLLRKRSAAIRHMVWTAAFSALLTLPALSFFLPDIRVQIPAALERQSAAFSASTSAGRESASVADKSFR